MPVSMQAWNTSVQDADTSILRCACPVRWLLAAHAPLNTMHGVPSLPHPAGYMYFHCAAACGLCQAIYLHGNETLQQVGRQC